jgi:hypothetical protein
MAICVLLKPSAASKMMRARIARAWGRERARLMVCNCYRISGLKTIGGIGRPRGRASLFIWKKHAIKRLIIEVIHETKRYGMIIKVYLSLVMAGYN